MLLKPFAVKKVEAVSSQFCLFLLGKPASSVLSSMLELCLSLMVDSSELDLSRLIILSDDPGMHAGWATNTMELVLVLIHGA